MDGGRSHSTIANWSVCPMEVGLECASLAIGGVFFGGLTVALVVVTVGGGASFFTREGMRGRGENERERGTRREDRESEEGEV